MSITGEMNLAEVVQALASVLGLWIIAWQIRYLTRSIHGTTQDNVYAHYMEVCKSFLQRPHLRPYFYDQAKLAVTDERNAKLRQEVDFMSEAVLGLIEHAVVQELNLPGDTWKHCWWPYARERLQKGTEMREFFDANQKWYTAALRDVVEMIDREGEPRRRGIRGLIDRCRGAYKHPA